MKPDNILKDLSDSKKQQELLVSTLEKMKIALTAQQDQSALIRAELELVDTVVKALLQPSDPVHVSVSGRMWT